MMRKFFVVFGIVLLSWQGIAQPEGVREVFRNPPEEASPWIFWYWMYGAVSKEGITADLEAMKEIGIGGTYLMPIKDSTVQDLYTPAVYQLTPEWWEMVRFAMAEAERLGLKLGMHICDGFALAGGPWITPELSMQKVVFADTIVQGGKVLRLQLPHPESFQGYYKDIALLALPVKGKTTALPRVTSSLEEDATPQYLTDPSLDGTFRSTAPCRVEYVYEKPFTCRSLTLTPGGNNFQAHRLRVAVSEDGEHFRTLITLQPPRHGWQNTDAGFTYALPETTARWFRFYWTPEGTEPGAEDLDAAKWKPNLKIKKIVLQGEPCIGNVEGKSGQVWRLSMRQDSTVISDRSCIQLEEIIDLTDRMSANGTVEGIQLPAGEWRLLRLGHTSTGHTNATGGGAKGLECDKFSTKAVRLQFDNWFGAAFEKTDPVLARRVLKRMHVDSWECGSQNWSENFAEEFKSRRGYDLRPYLALYAGIPLVSAEVSEQVLLDIRETIGELVKDVFYHTLAGLAREKDCEFSAECVAPTMMSDGLLHYQFSDRPMGEFWLRSPTHDKPNDMLDAICGAHIYGKRIIQAEGFTQLRTMWDEHPGMLKTLGDRNFALGINKLFFHVFAHHPFVDRRPGMTLDGIGLCMQRDQTWWKPAKSWVDYIRRCQAVLQQGVPVTDIAVFIGEQMPRRSILPDRLVSSLPGIFGEEKVSAEKKRMENKGQPMRTMPVGVNHSANLADPEAWIDPLQGYAYDSFNRDVFLKAKAENGRMVLPGGASYRVVVFPLPHQMAPDSNCMSLEVARKIEELQQAGVVVLLPPHRPDRVPGLQKQVHGSEELRKVIDRVWANNPQNHMLPFRAESFISEKLEKDIIFTDNKGGRADNIAWNHRRAGNCDIYFISNQEMQDRTIRVSLRESGRVPEWWQPVNGEWSIPEWKMENNRTLVELCLAPGESGFIVMEQPAVTGKNELECKEKKFTPEIGKWSLSFEEGNKTVERQELFDWSQDEDPFIRYYSGTVTYRTTLKWKRTKGRVFLDLGKVMVMAEVRVNGQPCGTVWTAPYRTEITAALKPGRNLLEIRVVNTWANRLKGVAEGRVSGEGIWTNAPYRLEKEALSVSGLIGPLEVRVQE